MKLSRALRVAPKEVIALVGAGGKTSAMFRLSEELTAQGWRVVTTTSTHIGADQIASAPRALILTPKEASQLTSQRLTHLPALLVGEINPQTGKAAGLSPRFIDRIASWENVDILINEADGARLLPFKAPADHEPVITPATTLVVVVVGVDAVGQPLDAVHIHRPERVAALTGAELGQPVSVEMIAAVLTHPDGGLKSVPPRARVMALVNKVRTKKQEETATRLSERLLNTARLDAVAIGSVQRIDPVRWVRSRIAAVVLAAGESRRFGRLKQLLPWDEGTLLTHAVDAAHASQANPVVVVLGHQADACQAALGDPSAVSGQGRPVTVVVNPDWSQGQSTSVRAGLAALPDNVGGVLFHLVDQPRVTPAVMNALVARHAATLAPVVWPEYKGRRGNPVLFDRVAFPQLKELTGESGGKPVLMAHARAGTAEVVAVDEPGVLLDIDTPEDLSCA
jgi:molybdenum cofactor cytidylyltransferase